MVLSILQLLSSPKDARVNLRTPFNIGDFTYASNGQVGIKIPKLEQFDTDKPITIKVDNIFDKFKSEELSFIPLNKAFPKANLDYHNCDRCFGSGYATSTLCEECKGEIAITVSNEHSDYDVCCKTCEEDSRSPFASDGYLYEYDPTHEHICMFCQGEGSLPQNSFISAKYCGSGYETNIVNLRHLYSLDNVLVASKEIDNWVMFKFDGGEGFFSTIRS